MDTLTEVLTGAQMLMPSRCTTLTGRSSAASSHTRAASCRIAPRLSRPPPSTPTAWSWAVRPATITTSTSSAVRVRRWTGCTRSRRSVISTCQLGAGGGRNVFIYYFFFSPVSSPHRRASGLPHVILVPVAWPWGLGLLWGVLPTAMEGWWHAQLGCISGVGSERDS